MYGSPFHLTTTKSHWPFGRDGGLTTLCHSLRFTCLPRVLKFFLALAIFAPRWGNLTMTFSIKFLNEWMNGMFMVCYYQRSFFLFFLFLIFTASQLCSLGYLQQTLFLFYLLWLFCLLLFSFVLFFFICFI